jgi:hypothetical protein
VNESSARTVIWDTTAPRHLALAGALDVLIAVTGLRLPRIVADPSEPTGDDLLIKDPDALSEICASEWHFLWKFRRHNDLADLVHAERLAGVRKRPELIVVGRRGKEYTGGRGAFVQVARVLPRDMPGGPLPRRAVGLEDLR